MESIEGWSGTRTRLSLSALLAAAVLFTPGLAREAAAQSDAGTVSATVTVEEDPILVTGVQDLAFGTHFPSEGVVENEVPAVWNIEVGANPTNVDLAFTALPGGLQGTIAGGFVPLSYGPNSFGAECGGVLVMADPGSLAGIPGCDISPGAGVAVLGDQTLGLDPVEVDLTGAGPNVYAGTIELTATIN